MKTKVVCMGDSITEGFGLTEEECYPSRLQELLGDAYEVVNKGVCCSTVLDVTLNGEQMGFPYVKQERYAQALAEKGDIYVILLGTNDAQDGMDDVEDFRNPLFYMISRKDEFCACYQKILNDVKNAAPSAKIYMGIPAPVMQCIWRKHQEKYLKELMPCFDELLIQNPGLEKIDVHGAFMAQKKEVLDSLYQEDHLHPNADGAFLIARTVYEKLK